MIPPWSWARATAAYDGDHFKRRIRACDDVDRLRAAVQYEVDRLEETRTERVATMNQRISQVKD